MLLEMQTAMNNMMNSSQLQHLLNGTIDSSQSDPSSSLPTPPDSPRSSSDLSESAVPMDTASSCSSDSGEEDALSTVSPAGSETLSSCSKEEEEPPRECWSRWNEIAAVDNNLQTTAGPYREHVTGYHVTQQCRRSPANLPYHTNNMNRVQTGHLVSDLLLFTHQY